MTRHPWLGAGSALSRCLGVVIGHWKLALVILVFASPVGPHLRWEYAYRETHGHRSYLRCTYLGSRGFITPDVAPDCPVIAFLDAREWR